MNALPQQLRRSAPASDPVGAEPPAVELDHVTRTHPGGIVALRDVSLRVPRGQFLAVTGSSGSGKSTLLQCAAGLDVPTSGRVRLAGTDLTGLSETARTRLRRDRVGFVFQAYNLLPALTVADNITLPLRLAGRAPDVERVRRLVDRVGLGDRLGHHPAELSGGQQQRAAIVRALVTDPAVVFADEPTGALDPRAGAAVLDLLRDLVTELGQTVVLVTHDPAAASRAHRTIVVEDGRITDDRTADGGN